SVRRAGGLVVAGAGSTVSVGFGAGFGGVGGGLVAALRSFGGTGVGRSRALPGRLRGVGRLARTRLALAALARCAHLADRLLGAAYAHVEGGVEARSGDAHGVGAAALQRR